MGSIKGQKSDGRYIDGFLYKNLTTLAKSISTDMTHLGVLFSSTLEVGTGKSVLATQIGEAWTDIVNQMYGKDLKFELNNIVWRPTDLIERSFKLPKYSCILLDEWEDSSYWSQLGITLRQFFRKCRQLNLFILVIIPNWFQLPLGYAIGRSTFAIDVRFTQGFTRGTFDFYGFENKRQLYIKGKKFHNYHVAKADFVGRFTDGYGVPDADYRREKLADMKRYDEEEEKPHTPTAIRRELVGKFKKNFPQITNKQIAEALEVCDKTISRDLSKNKEANKGDVTTRPRTED